MVGLAVCDKNRYVHIYEIGYGFPIGCKNDVSTSSVAGAELNARGSSSTPATEERIWGFVKSFYW